MTELFRRAQRRRVSRTVVATVARQDGSVKRVRGGGEARGQLRAEGIVIFGDHADDKRHESRFPLHTSPYWIMPVSWPTMITGGRDRRGRVRRPGTSGYQFK